MSLYAWHYWITVWLRAHSGTKKWFSKLLFLIAWSSKPSGTMTWSSNLSGMMKWSSTPSNIMTMPSKPSGMMISESQQIFLELQIICQHNYISSEPNYMFWDQLIHYQMYTGMKFIDKCNSYFYILISNGTIKK